MSFSNPTGRFSNTGTYAGDSAQNRAIPHGLGSIPSLVIITNSDAAQKCRGMIFKDAPTILFTFKDTAGGTDCIKTTVTAMTATNFYVGDAGGTEEAMNTNTTNEYWVAIK